MKALSPFKMSGATNPMTHCHIPEELNFNIVAVQNPYASFGLMEISELSI
jgi:hypothetical protein